MLINIVNSITFKTTKTTMKKGDAEITTYESKIQLPKPEKPAPAPILTEPKGFELVFEKNNQIKIAAVKPHQDPNCILITYKEYNKAGDLLTGQFDRNGNLISEYSTICYDWYSTMTTFNPCFAAATNISCEHEIEMYVPRFLSAAMQAFKRNPDKFEESIARFNHKMMQFNSMLENICVGIANIQSKLLHQLEEEKAGTEKYKEFLHQIQAVLSENDPEKYSGLIADIRGSLGVPVEERYIKAGTPAARHRRSRKEAAEAKNDKNDNK